MIFGIGTDIVEISRIAKAVKSRPLLAKCFTQAEIDRCNAGGVTAAENFAGYFAAKEAVAKALGTGFRGFAPRDIEICHDSLGKPLVRLSEKIPVPAHASVYISISHGKEHATAMAIIEVRPCKDDISGK
ncbi:MAG: holo-ACP synthase [Clostridiales bacterium]|jgi:holo-[acyl-carrier protein] synthase|nr:holo-ACP synthase [Clostridiales bacterium]